MTQKDEQQEDVVAADHEHRAALGPEGVGGDGERLDPDAEGDLWHGRTSWKHFLVLIVMSVGWSVVAIIIAVTTTRWLAWTALVLAAVLWIYVIVRMGYGVMSVRYRLTTQRLFVERGLLSRTIDQTELIRVDDVRVHKSLFDRIVGLGSIEVMSTDASDQGLRISGVVGAEDLADSIRDNMRRLRRKSLFIENL